MPEAQDQDKLQVQEESWRKKWRRVVAGLRAPPDSGEHKYAVLALQRIFGPSSASTGATILLLLLLLISMQFKPEVAPPELEVTIVDPETQELEEVVEEKEIPPEEVIDSMEPTEEVQNDMSEIVNEAPSFGDDSSEDIVPAAAVDIIKSPMVLRGLYGSRTAAGRAAAVGRYGGGGTGGGGSVTAVLKALRWLKAHQNEDGSWTGSDSKTAMAGLALLCYMAHGETPSSEEFGQTVEKAIRYLMYAQTPDGRFRDAGANYVYGHAIATYAMAESYTMTRIITLKEPVEKATQVIIDGQQPGGAWDYNYAKGVRKDISVSAWQIQALKAARLSGASNEKLEETILKATDGVRSFALGNGYLAYNGPVGNAAPSPTLTAAGVLCLQLLGFASDRTVRDGIDALNTLDCSWEDKKKPDNNTYAWYYATQAFFQSGGGPWERWNKRILPMLVQNQSEDGHWASGTTHSASDVYDTTLCCLCLEVYYRYLPTYERVEEVKREPKTKDERDIKIAVDTAL